MNLSPSQKKRSTSSRELILDSVWKEVQSCHESFHESSAHVGGCSLAVNGGPALSRVMLINAHRTPPTQELAQGAHKIVPYIEVKMFLGFYFHKKGVNLQVTIKLLVVSANFLHCVGVGISQGVGLFQLPTHKKTLLGSSYLPYFFQIIYSRLFEKAPKAASIYLDIWR